VQLPDHCTVEAVYYGSGTLCISSQVGCKVRCPFCLSGREGFFRNLSCDELILQVHSAWEKGLIVNRVTLSGVGEPLHNWKNILLFLTFCRQKQIPVSLTTIGSPLKNLDELFKIPHNGLMLSIHAGTAVTHRKLVPAGPSFEGLWDVVANNLDNMSQRKRRKIGINYLLIQGINDSTSELENLLARVRPYPELTLHLLGCNSTPSSSFFSPAENDFTATYGYLRAAFPNVRRNNRWRRQREGGCGTLLSWPPTSNR